MNVIAEAQLKVFIDKFEIKNQKLIRAMRKEMRKRFPGAFELVYDNYNFFVIGYSPTERPSDAVFSIAAGAKGVNLCFLRGADVPDPRGLLQGAGSKNRFIRIDSIDVMARPEVDALIDTAAERAGASFPPDKGTLVIRSVSAKQRPRQ